MSTKDERAITSTCRKCTAAKASQKRPDGRVTDLEATCRGKSAIDDKLSAQQILQELNSVESDLKTHHLTLMDLPHKQTQEGKELILDETDDKIASLTVRLQRLISCSSTVTTSSPFIESTLKQ